MPERWLMQRGLPTVAILHPLLCKECGKTKCAHKWLSQHYSSWSNLSFKAKMIVCVLHKLADRLTSCHLDKQRSMKNLMSTRSKPENVCVCVYVCRKRVESGVFCSSVWIPYCTVQLNGHWIRVYPDTHCPLLQAHTHLSLFSPHNLLFVLFTYRNHSVCHNSIIEWLNSINQ